MRGCLILRAQDCPVLLLFTLGFSPGVSPGVSGTISLGGMPQLWPAGSKDAAPAAAPAQDLQRSRRLEGVA
jgi:hypothetical protein